MSRDAPSKTMDCIVRGHRPGLPDIDGLEHALGRRGYRMALLYGYPL